MTASIDARDDHFLLDLASDLKADLRTIRAEQQSADLLRETQEQMKAEGRTEVSDPGRDREDSSDGGSAALPRYRRSSSPGSRFANSNAYWRSSGRARASVSPGRGGLQFVHETVTARSPRATRIRSVQTWLAWRLEVRSCLMSEGSFFSRATARSRRPWMTSTSELILLHSTGLSTWPWPLPTPPRPKPKDSPSTGRRSWERSAFQTRLWRKRLRRYKGYSFPGAERGADPSGIPLRLCVAWRVGRLGWPSYPTPPRR